MPPVFAPVNRVALERQRDDLFQAIADAQDGLRARYGRYQQFAASPVALPARGESAAFDAAQRPTDYPAGRDWTALARPASSNAALLQVAVHEYDGPQGQGYVIIARSRQAEGIWQFSRHVGPETYRDASANRWMIEPEPRRR